MSFRFVIPFFLSCLACLSLSGATFNWTGSGSDTLFTNEDNWSSAESGVPGTEDLALFDAAGESVVTFNANHTTGTIRFTPLMDGEILPTVIFDLGGFTYTATSGGGTTIMSPSGANAPRTVIIRNGELSLGGSNYWGHDGNSLASNNGESIVRLEQGATLRLTSSNFLSWHNNAGNTTSTEFIVEGGSSIIANDNVFGIAGNGTGTITSSVSVSGLGSSFVATGTSDRNVVHIGQGGNGTMSITDGASFSSSRAINVALTSTSVGVLTVAGGHLDEVESVFTASSVVGNQIYIGGGRTRDRSADQPSAGGEGLAEFINGGQGQFVTLVNYFNTNNDNKGTLRIDDGFVDITGTGTFEAGSVVELGLRSTAQDILMEANTLILGSSLQLIIDSGFSAALNDSIFLIEYSSLAGTFAGLAEGATVHADGYSFSIHYAMGEGENIIGLTVIPEPGHLALLTAFLATAVVVVRRRKKRVGDAVVG